jgi:hypothetical protein
MKLYGLVSNINYYYRILKYKMSIKDIVVGHLQSSVRKFQNVLGGKAGELEINTN